MRLLAVLLMTSNAVAAPLDLLAGRLSMEGPKGARVEARQRSIMAAAEPSATETRIVVDDGPARLVIMVYELFQLSPPDLAAAVAKEAGADFTVEPLALGAPLKAVAAMPKKPTESAATLIYRACVAQADGTLQALDFYINPKAFPKLADYIALAKKTAATITAGKRKLTFAAEKRALSDGISVDIPAGWTIAAQPGPDFVVHHIRKVAVLGAPAGSLHLYVGHHPSLQSSQADKPPTELKTVVGKAFGKSVSWSRWSADKRQVQEVIVPMSGVAVHIFATADDQATLDEALKVSETLVKK
jgi:hypothetical protein